MCGPRETHLKQNDVSRLKVERVGKVIYINTNKNGWAILISDKIDFEANTFIWGKVGHYTIIEELTQQGGAVFLNASN